MIEGQVDRLNQLVQAKSPVRTGLLNFVGLVILCVMVALPRLLPFPPLFLTYDEIQIALWTNEMTRGALAGTWQDTANNAYPAVTLAWLETIQVEINQLLPGQSLDTAQMLADGDKEVFASLPRRRLALALVNTLIIMAIFWLLRRLFNNFVAVSATILMAFDPFLLTQSRVFRTEGLNTGLMMLSALTIILYAKERRSRWLVASSILAGWAILTKFTSVYLLPFTGLTLLAWPLLQGEWKIWPLLKQVVRDTLAWSLVMGLTFFVFWPALWVSPLTALSIINEYLWDAVEGSLTWGGSGVFFRGEIIRGDPGVLFYIWSLAYRTTPMVWLGLAIVLAGLAGLLLSRRQSSRLSRLSASFTALNQMLIPTLLILAYVVFYFIGMSLGITKIDRFLHPIFPGLSILAAIGFLLVAEFFRLSGVIKGGIWAILLVSSLWLALPHHPYYFTYWNPLLGGAKGAIKNLPVGSLEGVDVMVERLHALPDVGDIRLAGPTMQKFCSFFFEGICLDESEFLTSDYFIVYAVLVQTRVRLSNIQDFIPDIELVDKFTKDGVDYVWLYKMPPGLQQTGQWLGNHGKLIGYRLPASPVGAGDPLKVTIFWLNGQDGWTLHDSEIFVKLLDKTGRVQLIAPAQLEDAFIPYQSQPDEILAFMARFELPPDISPDVYTIEIGLRLKETGEETWTFSLVDLANTIMVNRGALDISTDALPIQHRLEQNIGETGLTLLGYDDLTNSRLPGFALYWQAKKPPAENYVLDLRLLDGNGQVAATWRRLLAPEIHPITTWQPGETIKLFLPLALGHPLPGGIYQPELAVFSEARQENSPLAKINLQPLASDFALAPPNLPMRHHLNVTFSDHLDLLGYDVGGQQNVVGGSLFVSLYWLNRRPLMATEAQIQVLSESGEVITEQILPVPNPADFSTWQSISHYEFPLKSPPASLIIKARPTGTADWYEVQPPGKPAIDQVIIQNVLGKM